MLLKDKAISVYEYKYKIASPWVEGDMISLECLGDNEEPTGEIFKMSMFEFINHAEVEE